MWRLPAYFLSLNSLPQVNDEDQQDNNNQAAGSDHGPYPPVESLQQRQRRWRGWSVDHTCSSRERPPPEDKRTVNDTPRRQSAPSVRAKQTRGEPTVFAIRILAAPPGSHRCWRGFWKQKEGFGTAAALLLQMFGKGQRPTLNADIQPLAVRLPVVGERAVPGARVWTGHWFQVSDLWPRVQTAIWLPPLHRRFRVRPFHPTLERGVAVQLEDVGGAGGDWAVIMKTLFKQKEGSRWSM